MADVFLTAHLKKIGIPDRFIEFFESNVSHPIVNQFLDDLKKYKDDSVKFNLVIHYFLNMMIINKALIDKISVINRFDSIQKDTEAIQNQEINNVTTN